ncbi:MAG: hypothetical protein E6R03_14050 [Hyphomicrobiaceae bacterium]|nr:MAG: hypothetical protein E6R03_14050 [Hyphomicrobiaceae bacterium]
MKRELAMYIGKKPVSLDKHVDIDADHVNIDGFLNDWAKNPRPACCSVRKSARAKPLDMIDVTDVPYSSRITRIADVITVTDNVRKRVLKDRCRPDL